MCFYLHPPFIWHLCSFPPALPCNKNGLGLSRVAATEIRLETRSYLRPRSSLAFLTNQPFSAAALSASHQSAGHTAGQCCRIREKKSEKPFLNKQYTKEKNIRRNGPYQLSPPAALQWVCVVRGGAGAVSKASSARLRCAARGRAVAGATLQRSSLLLTHSRETTTPPHTRTPLSAGWRRELVNQPFYSVIFR